MILSTSLNFFSKLVRLIDLIPNFGEKKITLKTCRLVTDRRSILGQLAKYLIIIMQPPLRVDYMYSRRQIPMKRGRRWRRPKGLVSLRDCTRWSGKAFPRSRMDGNSPSCRSSPQHLPGGKLDVKMEDS